jgi:hypothetical protein
MRLGRSTINNKQRPRAQNKEMQMANGISSSNEVEIPKTITPGSVWVGNAFLFTLSLVVFTLLLIPFAEWWSPVCGLIATLLALGFAIGSGTIAEEVVDFHGELLFNPWERTRRVLFPGLSFKLPWESVERDGTGAVVVTSLVRIISSKGVKSHPTNDPAENMEVSLLIHLRVNTSGSPETSQENFIRFRAIAENALTEIVRAEIEKMFAEYFAEHEMEELLKLSEIQKAVLTLPTNADSIHEMEKKYGICIGVVLDASNPDKATKDMKRTPAMAEALREAIQILVTSKVMDPEQARRAALLLDPNTDYTERKFSLDIDAPDLKNMQHFSAYGVPGSTEKKGGKK